MKIKLQFHNLKKAISILTIVTSFSFLFNPAAAKNIATVEEQSNITSRSVSPGGELVIIASPCVPAGASIGKNNYRPGQGLNDKAIIHTFFYSTLEKSIFSSCNIFSSYGKYSLRLHLAFCVLLI